MIALGLGLGLVLIAYGFSRLAAARAEAAPPAAPARYEVVVAARSLPRGHRLDAQDLAMAEIASAPPGAFGSSAQVSGRVTAVDVADRQVLTAGALVGQGSGASLADLVPIGYRAISLDTNDEIAVSNLLRPGDLVDVQLVLSRPAAADPGSPPGVSATLLQAVRVISVGDAVAGGGSNAGGPGPSGAPARRTMTLAMTPEQVAMFTLARSVGSFYLALRNPDDRQAEPPALARLSDITGRGEVAAVSSPAAAVVRPPPQSIELVIGDQRRTIYPR